MLLPPLPRPPFALTRFLPEPSDDRPLVLHSEALKVVEGNGNDVVPALRGTEAGGEWFGFLGYELGEVAECITPRPSCSWRLPDFWFARFAERKEFTFSGPSSPPRVLSPCRPSLSRSDYVERLGRIDSYLRAGDVYQTNLSVRFEVDAQGDPLALFLKLLESTDARYACYLDLGEAKILSLSPELFLHVAGGRVVTQPIKGTIGKSGDPDRDRDSLEWLLRSPKNLAELLMIVDLERNDLGRLCRYGSISVDSFPEVLELPHLYHLCATIRGALREGTSLEEIFYAAFPGGSISGAPKRRAMEVIRELEPHRRDVYCGAIGWMSARSVHLNLAIRTGVWREGTFRFWGGGGIVADHDPQSEQKEVVDKLGPFVDALGLARRDFWS